MNSAVLYYSFSGHTRALAHEIAAAENAILLEADAKYNFFTAFFACGSVSRFRPARLRVPLPDLTPFDALTLLAPVWNGYPAPPLCSMIEALPTGKAVTVVLTSSSGDSAKSHAGLAERIAARGCTLQEIRDVKT